MKLSKKTTTHRKEEGRERGVREKMESVVPALLKVSKAERLQPGSFPLNIYFIVLYFILCV